MCTKPDGKDKGLCSALSTVGKHTLGELEGASGFNGTISLPHLPPAIKLLIQGRWKSEIKIQAGSEIVAYIRLPANEEWLYIME
ncbi:hypothetical protein AAVH_24116 [Aphelenchoides avenae]|nr:hypothetical protein AAVH_24115 [Aphelenchus avenae]KAH7708628.1 hypothetical protein AAVH_24116 [Aphelenchus avenae]